MKSALLVGLAALGFAAACAKDQGTISKAEQARKTVEREGWTRRDFGTFSMELPEEWVVFDFSKQSFAEAMEATAKNNPEIRKLVEPMKVMAEAGYLKLFAFDTANSTEGFTPNCNVIEMPLPKGTTFEQLLAENDKQMAATGSLFKRGAQREFEQGGVKFRAEDMGMNMKDATGKSHDLVLNSNIGFKEGKQVVVTFTTLKSKAAGMKKVADEAMGTFRAT